MAKGVIFEIITPPQSWPEGKVRGWASRVARILEANDLTRLNLPEVVSESRDGSRRVSFLKKMDNVRFGEVVREVSPGVTLIPNKISVRVSPERFRDWVGEVYDRGVRDLVLVGGESHRIEYPGWSVPEAASFVRENYPDVRLGGITIFTRPREADRIVAKMKAGIDFFCSQIVFETANLKQVTAQLDRRCREEGLRFPDVYVSLTPASRIRDIEFMTWLGVEFPSAVLGYLVEEEERIEERTFEVVERVIGEVSDFTAKEGIRLGFNVEHVMYSNLELSERILDRILES
jgi:5,10-methylenetetrahydrofolate reductase